MSDIVWTAEEMQALRDVLAERQITIDALRGKVLQQEIQAQSLQAELTKAQQELAQAKRWQMVADGTYKGLVSRHLIVENGGTRIGLDFDVYDCNTGDWTPHSHFTTFYHDVRLFRLVEEEAD